MSLYKLIANIICDSNSGRTSPIITGYKPQFLFLTPHQTDGYIKLLNIDKLNIGETVIAEIYFVSTMLLGEVKIGTKFKFFEGGNEMGNGEILQIIGWVDKIG